MIAAEIMQRAGECVAVAERCQFAGGRAPIDNVQFLIVALCLAAAFVVWLVAWQFSSVTLFRGQGLLTRNVLGLAFGTAMGAWTFYAVDNRLEPPPVTFNPNGTAAERRSVNDTAAWMGMKPNNTEGLGSPSQRLQEPAADSALPEAEFRPDGPIKRGKPRSGPAKR